MSQIYKQAELKNALSLREKQDREERMHTLEDHSLPPNWFQHPETRRNHQLHYPGGQRVASVNPFRCSLSQMLDHPIVYLPTYAFLVALTMACYPLVHYLTPPHSTSSGDLIYMYWHLHAVGGTLLCSGFVIAFHSLRQLARCRNSWTVGVAKVLGIPDEQCKRVQTRDEAVKLIVDLWHEANSRVEVARADLCQHLLILSADDLRQRATECGKLEAMQLTSIDLNQPEERQGLAQLIAAKVILKPWQEALYSWKMAIRIQTNWRFKRWRAEWVEWQALKRKWQAVAVFRGMRGEAKGPREPLLADYCNARDHVYANATSNLLRDMENMFHPNDSTVDSQLADCLNREQDLIPPPHVIGYPHKTRLPNPTCSALGRLRWSSCYWLDSALRVQRMDKTSSNQRPSLTLIDRDSHASLERWRNVVIASTLIMFASICRYVIVLWPGGDSREHSAVAVCVLVAIAISMFFFAAWGISLVLAVGLVKDALKDLGENCARWLPIYGVSIIKDGWAPLIQRPALELVHTTLPALSAWETSVCWICLSHLMFGVFSLPLAATMYNNHENDLATRYMILVVMLVAFVVPLLLLYLPASISTTANKLLDDINQLRMLECDDSLTLERMQRAANLIQYLDRINHRKGPGFVLFGMVVLDIRLLKTFVVTMGVVLGNLFVYFHLV